MGGLTFTGPLAPMFLAKVGAAAAGALALLYVIKLRLRTVEVPFSQLWAMVLKETKSSSWWRRFKRILSFLVQVLAAFLLLAAATDPTPKSELQGGRHILVLIDASASMTAQDGRLENHGKGPFTRLEEAKVRLKHILAHKQRRDKVMIVQMDSQVTALSSWTEDSALIDRTIDRVHATHAPADLARALRFTRDVLSSVSEPTLLLVGDGGYDPAVLSRIYWGTPPPATLGGSPAKPRKKARARTPSARTAETARSARGSGAHKTPTGKSTPVGPRSTEPARPPRSRTSDHRRRNGHDEPPARPVKAPRPPALGGGAALSPIGLGTLPVSILLVGQSRNNVGITAFNARRYLDDRLNYEVFSRITNYQTRPTTIQIQLYSGGQIPDTATLHLEAGQTKTFIRRAIPAVATNLIMKLTPSSGSGRLDDFPLDDVGYALIPERPAAKTLLVSSGNLYLEGALLLDTRNEYDRIPHDQYKPEMVKKYNVVIFDGYHGERLPSPGNYLLFNPDKDSSPIPIAKQVANPPIMWPSEPKHRRHAIMKFVTLKNVNTVKASIFELGPKDRPLMMTDERGPVFAAVRRTKGQRIVEVGFSLKQTDWVIRISFPVFLLETINWFLGDDPRLIPTYRTGRLWRIPVDIAGDKVEAFDPMKRRFVVPVSNGFAKILGKYVGYYTILADKHRIKVAANLANPIESKIEVPKTLRFGSKTRGRDLGPIHMTKNKTTTGHRASNPTLGWLLFLLGVALLITALVVGPTGPLWAFVAMVCLAGGSALLAYSQGMHMWTSLLAALLVLLVAEWITYNRRVTV